LVGENRFWAIAEDVINREGDRKVYLLGDLFGERKLCEGDV